MVIDSLFYECVINIVLERMQCNIMQSPFSSAYEDVILTCLIIFEISSTMMKDFDI